MAVGLVGTVLPVIPGILLIYAGYLLYGFATGWQAYGLAAIVGWSVVTGFVLLLDFYAGAIGAKGMVHRDPGLGDRSLAALSAGWQRDFLVLSSDRLSVRRRGNC
jgi:hypothetical protein